MLTKMRSSEYLFGFSFGLMSQCLSREIPWGKMKMHPLNEETLGGDLPSKKSMIGPLVTHSPLVLEHAKVNGTIL